MGEERRDDEICSGKPVTDAAEEMSAPVPKKKKKKALGKILYFALIAIFVGVFIYCAIYIASYLSDSIQQGSTYEELLSRVENAKNNGEEEVEYTIPEGMGGSISNGNSEGTADESRILPQYRELYALNNDLVGWITVPGTVIDYPVVQSPNNVDYYLDHNFNGKYSSWGCIYAREQCDVFTPCDNVVLYGHHMKDGSMFAALDKYKRKSYWQENQYMYFNTIYEEHMYQIIAVFKTSANMGQGFAYHIFNYANSEEEFNEFMDNVHDLQMYKTGISAEYGDVLLTLSTCEYTLDNGRFVVIAKRLTAEEAAAAKAEMGWE